MEKAVGAEHKVNSLTAVNGCGAGEEGIVKIVTI